MSTFKQCTYNTITKSNGQAVSGRLLYSYLDGGNESKPVYFGLKDDTTWVGNLSTKGTSSFYLTSDTNGCTAEVKDSTYTPTTDDANTAREIWLNIPKATATRTIKFSYNGITVLTVKQIIPVQYEYVFFIPTITNEITSPGFCIVSEKSRNITLSTSEFNKYIFNIGGSYNKDAFICVCLNTNKPSSIPFNGQLKDLNLTYVSGNNYLNNSTYSNYWIIPINNIITELNNDGTVKSVVDNLSEVESPYTTFDVYSIVQSLGVTKVGNVYLNKLNGMVAKV